MTLVLEIGRRIDELLDTADRSQLVRLLATLKHREVLILEALHPATARTPAEGLVALADVAAAFRVSTRTAYRMARVAPLRDYAVWSSPDACAGSCPASAPCSRAMSREDRGSGRLFLPTWSPGPGRPRVHSAVWWWEIPDGHGGKLRGSTGIKGGKLGKPPKEAKEVLWQKRAELGRGDILPGALTWDRVSVAYLQQCEALGVASTRLYRARARHLDAFFAGVRARDIVEERDEAHTVAAFVAHRRAQGAQVSTINQEIGLLKRVFGLAVQKGACRAGLTRLGCGKQRPPGFIPDQDLEAMLPLMPADRADVAVFLRLTGWRESEPLLLELRQVDWALQVVRLDASQSKTRRPREFPFGDYPALRELLERRRELAVALGRRLGRIIPHVFFDPDGAAITVGAFYASWCTARRRLGLRWTPHDLRRTFARWALLQGTDPTTVMALAGWESLAMLKRYAIKDLVPLQAGAARLGAAAAPASASTGQLALFRA